MEEPELLNDSTLPNREAGSVQPCGSGQRTGVSGKATIHDVARLAGVSVATVSRALNGGYPVRQETRDTIMKAITALEYYPNMNARGLKSGKTRVVGMVILDIANPFGVYVAKAVESVISGHGYNLMITNTSEKNEDISKSLAALLERDIDGLVIVTEIRSRRLLQRIRDDEHLPVVLIDKRLPDLRADLVIDDNCRGAFLLVRHLLELGHRSIALIDGPLTMTTGAERYRGYRDALAAFGIPIRRELVHSGRYTREFAREATTRILKQTPDVTAIFAANNHTAKGVIIAMRQLGKKIPDDLSLVCFGEDEFTNVLSPMITCIVQKPAEMGRLAGEMLIERIEKRWSGEPRMVIIPPELFIGESCCQIGEKQSHL